MASNSDTDSEPDLPPILKEPELQKVPVPNVAGVIWNYVIFAIATTGLDIYQDEICQLGLIYKTAERLNKWYKCMLPSRSFHPEATKINGFSKEFTSTGKLSLCWKDKGNSQPKTIRTTPVNKVLKLFQAKLKKLSRNGNHRILLIVYKASYDVRILFRTMNECGISPNFLMELNIGFVDMLELIKSMSSVLPGIEDFKQRTVYGYLVNDPDDKNHVHDVHKDVETLLVICEAQSTVRLETYLAHSSTAKSQHEQHCFKVGTHKRLQTMKGKLFSRKGRRKDIVCETTARKIAASGLKYKHLKRLHKKASQLEFTKQMKLRGLRKDTSKKLADYLQSNTLYEVRSGSM